MTKDSVFASDQESLYVLHRSVRSPGDTKASGREI